MRPAPQLLRSRGFTMVELVIVVVVIAIIGAIASPGFMTVLTAQRIRSASSDLVSSLLSTRSEAIKRNSNMYVLPRSGGDWRTGWVVYTAAFSIIDSRNPLGVGVAVARAPDYVVYTSAGRVANGSTLRFELYDEEAAGSAANKRCVSLDASGLPRLTKGACP